MLRCDVFHINILINIRVKRPSREKKLGTQFFLVVHLVQSHLVKVGHQDWEQNHEIAAARLGDEWFVPMHRAGRTSVFTCTRAIVKAKTRDTPAPLRHAATASLISRWTAFLTHAALSAFAASLLFEDPAHHHNLDGEPPPLSDLLAQLPPDPTDPSRLPPHHPWFVNGLCL